MSAQAGWYPDPGGGQNLFRYWDGRAWSAATTYNPQAPPPVAGCGAAGQPPDATPPSTQAPSPSTGRASRARTRTIRPTQKRKSPVGWWIAAAALVVVIVVVAVIAVRAIGGGAGVTTPPTGGQPSQDVCPQVASSAPRRRRRRNPTTVGCTAARCPTRSSARPGGRRRPTTACRSGATWPSQLVSVEPNYSPGSNWVASILVGELQAGDGFFTPEQGAQIVVKCILGEFYGDNPVRSDVQVNKATTIDGNQAWLVESQLTFDIDGLETKGELLIVAIVATESTAGLYYASIPDTSRNWSSRPATPWPSSRSTEQSAASCSPSQPARTGPASVGDFAARAPSRSSCHSPCAAVHPPGLNAATAPAC